jgi:osmoprotectant transport system ATP-binding protein
MSVTNTLTLEHISHWYGHRQVLCDVSFTATEKTITAILGKSGSGKSTLLQIINGMMQPANGQVFFLGRPFDYSQANELRSQMGYAIQGIGLFPHLNVEQNILITTRIRKNPTIDTTERLDLLMSKMNLPPSFKFKYPHELSGGEQQRVGICRALFNNPPMLLMDEPLAALDSITQDAIINEILNLHKSDPRTTIFITHNPYEALSLADYVLILDEGRVIQHDTKENILQHPANEIVERLTRVKRI